MARTARERLESPVATWDSVNIASYIKRRLAEEGISNYELADRLGVEKANLNKAINGKIPMPMKRMETILWILDGHEQYD